MHATTAFVLTLVIEVPLLLAAWSALGWRRRTGWARCAATGVAVNLTNPVLWLLHPATWPALVLAEVVVVPIEGLAAWALLGRPRRDVGAALLAALVSNSASFLAGLVISLAAR